MGSKPLCPYAVSRLVSRFVPWSRARRNRISGGRFISWDRQAQANVSTENLTVAFAWCEPQREAFLQAVWKA